MAFEALPLAPALLGESPFWHPEQGCLYWVDIPGKALHRYHPPSAAHRMWPLDSEAGCCAPLPGGDLLLAQRDGLHRFNPETGQREPLAEPPYQPQEERFNDGKADAQGRLWVSTLYEPRQPPRAALYRWAAGKLARMAGDITVGNGLAFSPDGATMYWSDTTSHRIFAFDFDGAEGTISRQRVLAEFALRQPGQELASYGGRPDGAAVDAEGAYWCAMFEGQRLLRLAPDGRLLQELRLPVRCPTMPCFGGPDLRTLYITTARHNRPAAELAAQPLAGCVLATRVDVPGLPVNFARG
ncbi:6-deoxy-6-sulfogluconolactonase [Rubrivivax sp. A210]|uniref:SMP-30/gluconolactonase/LRE family protein n=1 Tax=Rubrivivax sp. A210 TaxID=2772301 RepID=UPI00191B254C|nr:SMP-30/gluconolactonase/LRE family protein [Rubrivivax sp. A210]CAD5370163.1 6-deoxy-6-sulfogluconolactonase [Rubrivivax sp. A210]